MSSIEPPDRSDTNASFRDLYEDIGGIDEPMGAVAPISSMARNFLVGEHRGKALRQHARFLRSRRPGIVEQMVKVGQWGAMDGAMLTVLRKETYPFGHHADQSSYRRELGLRQLHLFHILYNGPDFVFCHLEKTSERIDGIIGFVRRYCVKYGQGSFTAQTVSNVNISPLARPLPRSLRLALPNLAASTGIEKRLRLQSYGTIPPQHLE